MRAGEDPSATTTSANKKARSEGFARLTMLLKQIDTQTTELAPASASKQATIASKPTAPVSCEHGATATPAEKDKAMAAIM
jgi:hypothetical protein